MAKNESEAHYRALFDATGSALVEEDFSRVRLALEEIKSKGVEDIGTYFIERPDELKRCIDLIRILRFNRGFVEILNIREDQSVGPIISPYIPDGTMGVFRRELEALYEGRTSIDITFENLIPGAKAKYLRMRLAIVPGHDTDWASVLVSFTDLTAETGVRDELAALVQQKDVLMRELEHRVKNSLNIVSSLLSLESDRIAGDAERKILMDAQSRIKSIALIYELLSRSTMGASLNCKSYIDSLAHLLQATYAAERMDIVIELALDDFEIDVKRGVSLGLVVTELLTNAFKYAFPQRGGKVEIELAAQGDSIGLSLADDGIGAGEDFKATGSLGFQLIDMLVKQMRGAIAISPKPGFRVDIRIPLAG